MATTTFTVNSYTTTLPDGQRLIQKRVYEWTCEHGHRFQATAYGLRRGSRTCRECRTHFGRFEDLVGKRYGRLVVTERSGSSMSGPNGSHAVWRLTCDECGDSFLRSTDKMKRIKLCPCHKRHGRSRSHEYRAWNNMINRCSNESHPSYPRYGGRGIKVCDAWRQSFDAFYADMGDPPSPSHSIDRIDNDGHYCKDNCRWATTTEQRRNTPQNTMVTFRGETRCLVEWAEITGIDRHTLRSRIVRKKWNVERALTEPVQVQNRR